MAVELHPAAIAQVNYVRNQEETNKIQRLIRANNTLALGPATPAVHEMAANPGPV